MKLPCLIIMLYTSPAPSVFLFQRTTQVAACTGTLVPVDFRGVGIEE
jgi:hypothetical protein